MNEEKTTKIEDALSTFFDYVHKQGIEITPTNIEDKKDVSYYDMKDNVIHAPYEDKTEASLKTVFHEAVHSTMKPLQRKVKVYAFEEMVAETGAGKALSAVDCQTTETMLSNIGYVTFYANQCRKGKKGNYSYKSLVKKAKEFSSEAVELIFKSKGGDE